VVEYLLDNGADASPEDRWGGTPLDDAVRHGHGDVAQLLTRRGARPSEALAMLPEVARPDDDRPGIVELIYAAAEGDLGAIQRLVARGVELGAADYDLRTPLHLAAAEGHEAVVQYFIDQGVELSPRDRWGGTPFDDARRHGHARVAQLLQEPQTKTSGRVMPLRPARDPMEERAS
jgi:glutaminase